MVPPNSQGDGAVSIPYIPLYVTDYEADTAHLSIEEDGAYMRLLRLCWRTPGCSIPDDRKWIMRKMRATADEYDRVIEPVLDEFFTRGMGRWFQARLQLEYQRIHDLHEKRSAAGKAGNNKRWSLKTKQKMPRKAKSLQSHLEPEPEPELKGVNPLTPLAILRTVLRQETAEDFIAHRKAMRKPVTEVAAKRLVAAVKGHPDPDTVFDTSIRNGWQGVFPEKITTEKRDEKPTGAEIARRAAAAYAARRMDSGQDSNSVVPLLPNRRAE